MTRLLQTPAALMICACAVLQQLRALLCCLKHIAPHQCQGAATALPAMRMFCDATHWKSHARGAGYALTEHSADE